MSIRWGVELMLHCIVWRRIFYLQFLSLFFFFSSRRRHTRFDCDWSSDVCSSDLSWRAALALLATLTLRTAPAVAAAAPPAADSDAGTAAVLEINGPIGPATSRYVVHGIEPAHDNGSRVVVL